ncbi:expansin family protein [Zalerion maritima]|uniref:Expansin family protein n=1 Tax=Zalerion maritima TaxID=339359 RepID=A0AAD5WM85_9PEZI|nr:expansin family protein [Zalerion maritima]
MHQVVGTGSCGWSVTGIMHVVALSISQQGNPAALCGRGITIDTRGYQVKATVMDSCAGCNWGDVDVDEQTLIEFFRSANEESVKNIQWWFNSEDRNGY